MILLDAHQLQHFFNDRLILDIDELYIYKHDRIGLVGKNGSGKTTLLNALARVIITEKGIINAYVQSQLLPQLKRTDSTKSGGEVTQEYINEAFIHEHGILFADEPTNNLDTEHIEWVEKKLLKWQGAVVVVSHDRAFLDAICTKIWEINEGKIKEYKGNYSDYEKQKENELNYQKLEYEKYERKKKQLEEAILLKKRKAERATKAPKNVSSSEAKITGAKPYFAKKQKKLQKVGKAIEMRLEKLEKVEKVKETAAIKMDVPGHSMIKNRIVVRVENCAGKVDNRILWNETSFFVRGGDKIAIIGPNGCGKTTLIKMLVNKHDGITITPQVKIGYFSQDLSILDVSKTVLENVSSTSSQNETIVRTVLARLHFINKDVYKRVEVLSGGERVKVALAKLFVSDINMLILDEPTNYLDIHAISALESLLKEYDGTIIFASHDRNFISAVATRILSFENREISMIEGRFQQFKREKSSFKKDQLLVIQTKITEVLSRLSIEPSEELEQEFQLLLKKKHELS